MDYVYNDKYGSEQPHKMKRKKDKYGDDIPWQYEYDNAVNKGLVQIMREDKLPFDKLIKVIQREMRTVLKRAIAQECLTEYTGVNRYAVLGSRSDNTTAVSKDYWVEQLSYISNL